MRKLCSSRRSIWSNVDDAFTIFSFFAAGGADVGVVADDKIDLNGGSGVRGDFSMISQLNKIKIFIMSSLMVFFWGGGMKIQK